MDSIKLMIEEHELISRMLKVMRKFCAGILAGESVDYDDVEQMMDFVKNYADAHHHGKEEKFLFRAMEENLGALGQKLIRNGMLVEHDLGRLYMSDLREALERVNEGDEESKLDVIASMISYTHLLERHIAKENEVVYTFGQRQLAEEVMNKVNTETVSFEQKAEEAGVQKKYNLLVEAMERKYLG